MTGNQQNIINNISAEISIALNYCEHHRHEQGGDIDKIESYIKSYVSRVALLRTIRTDLENEFTIMHYDPR